MSERVEWLPANRLVIMAVVFSILLSASLWIALTSTNGRMRSVSLPASTYDALVEFGDANRNSDGTPMSVVLVIDTLITAKAGSRLPASP